MSLKQDFYRLLRAAQLGVILGLSACATTPTGQSTQPVISSWQPDRQWWDQAKTSAMGLRRPDGGLITLSLQASKTIADTRDKLFMSHPLEVDFVLADLPYANAHALEVEGRAKVVLGLRLIRLFENDPDALRFIIAHEYSHIQLGHLAGNRRADRESAFQHGGYLAGTLANLFIPFSSVVVSQAVVGLGRQYSREDERHADEAALSWLEQESLPVCGAWRLTRKLRPIHGAQALSFLSTHPSLDEREAYFFKRALARGEVCQSGTN